MSTPGCSCRYRSSLRTCSGGPGGTSCTGQYRYLASGQRNSFPESPATANLPLQQGDTDGACAAFQSVIDNGPACPAAAAALNLAMLLIAGHDLDAARPAPTLAINSGEADITSEAQRLLNSLNSGPENASS